MFVEGVNYSRDLAAVIRQRCGLVIKNVALQDFVDNINFVDAKVLIVHVTQKHNCDTFNQLRCLKEDHPELSIIITSSFFDGDIAIWALRSRIWDYIILPNELDYLIKKLGDLIIIRAHFQKKRQVFFPGSAKSPAHTSLYINGVQKKTDKVVDYIRGNYSEKLRLCELAELCHLSQDSVSRLFKQEQGLTVQEYIKNIRIEFAKKKLLNQSSSIQQVAISVGYDNISLFNRQFKQVVGVSPKAFRIQVA